MHRLVLAIALFALVSPAQGLVLDDFSSGSQFLESASGSVISHVVAPGVVGGHRSIYLNVVTNTFGNDATARVNGGAFSHNDEAGVYSESLILYGNDASGTFVPLNLDLSGLDRFRIHFLEADHGVNLNLVVFSVNGSSYSSFGVNLPPSPNPFSVDAPFSLFIPFTAGGGFDDIDFITIILQRASGGGTGSDLAIGRFEAVPEPASLCTIAIGIGALAAGRRRSTSFRRAPTRI